MRRGTLLLILLAVVALALGGFYSLPTLIAVGLVLARMAWVAADRDELLRMFA